MFIIWPIDGTTVLEKCFFMHRCRFTINVSVLIEVEILHYVKVKKKWKKV